MPEPFDLENARVGITLPKIFAGVGILAGLLFGAGLGYGQLATETYVDDRAKTVDSQLRELAASQKVTVEQVATLARRADKSDRSMDTMVRLVKIQFVEHIDAQEARPQRVKRKPRSAKSRQVAQLLQIDPDDPMAGIELLEATDHFKGRR